MQWEIECLVCGVWCMVFGALRLWQLWVAQAKRPKHYTPNTKHYILIKILRLYNTRQTSQITAVKQSA